MTGKLMRLPSAGVRNRECHAKFCSSWYRIQFNLAVMPLDQSSRDIQPKPCAFAYRLRGEKWIKDAITNLGRNARAIVDNPDYHSVALAIRDQIHAAALTHGVQRIVEQVRPNLIEFTAKSIHRWKVLLDVH